ncbi:hypothetical protein FDB39_03295 [Clostridium botulinum]|nr:hypothetical protein [Clostridium botulinum]
MSNIHNLEIDVDLKENLIITATCKQLDDLNLKFNVWNNGEMVDLSEYKCRLKAFKQDQIPLIQNTSININNNVVNIIADEQFTTTSGTVKVELQFINKNTGKKKSTFNIIFKVMQSVLEVERSISKATCTLLKEIDYKLDQIEDIKLDIIEAVKVKNDLNTSRTDANNMNNTLKTTTTSADNKKKEVETAINNASSKIKEVQDSTATANAAKQSVDSSIIQANSSKQALDTSKTNADNKKKEVDAAIIVADEKIEIIKKLDPENVVEDVKKLKEQVLENTYTKLETDSTLTKLDNCENSFVHNMQIKGKTLQNLWNNENVVSLKNDAMLIQTISTDDFRTNMLKDNIEYSIVNLSNKKTRADITTKNSNAYVKTLYIEPHSIQKFTISSQYISSFYGLISEGWTNTDSDRDIFKKACMILEGDYTNKEIPQYFEGIKSVGEAEDNKISILTTGKNLWDGTYQKAYVGAENGRTYRNDDACRATIVKCKPNTNYIFSKQSESDRKTMACFDNFPVNNSVATKSVLSDKITTDANSKYLVVYVSTNREEPLIQIEEGTESTAYEEYKEDKTEILLPSPHMGLPNGIGDIIDYDKNERIKNVGKASFIGSDNENWTINAGYTNDALIRFDLTNNNFNLKPNTLLVCNKFVSTILGSNAGEAICTHSVNQAICIYILKSKLETPDVAGFKKLLKTWADAGTPLEVCYQLANPVIEKLQIKDTLQAFENGYIQLDNAITPTAQLEYSTNLPSALGGLTKVVDKLVDDVTNVEITISDMDAEIGEARKGKTTLNERLEEDRTNILNELRQLSNPNLLINGSPSVWQRGATFINKQTYTADRWFYVCYNKPEKGSLSKDIDGSFKIFDFNGSQNYIQQIIETVDSIKIIGKTVTLSADIKVSNMTKGGIFIQLLGSEGIDKIDYDTAVTEKLILKPSDISSGYKNFKLSWNIPSNIKTIIIQIGSHVGTGGIVNNECILNIKNIKLELGSTVTPFTPRPYGEELALCQRYYFRNRWLSTKISGMGSKIITTTSFYYPTTMRIAPTVRPLIEQPIDAIRTMDYSVNIVKPNVEQIKPRQSGIINEEMIDFQFDSNLEVKDYSLEIKDYSYEFDSEIY